MGDFNIDLLKTDTHRPTHEYLEFIYSYSMLPTIYEPTRITATTATCIDNILTNNVDVLRCNILVTDISDHLPTFLSCNLDVVNSKNREKKYVYKRNHSNDNISKLKQKLSNVNWQETLDNSDVNDDYTTFVETFENLYDECIPLKNVKSTEKETQYHHGLLKVC